MQRFTLDFDARVQKDLRGIPKEMVDRIFEKVLALTENPFPVGVKKLQGLEETYRIRIGDYRVVYLVNTKEHLVYIDYISHRRDAYG
jgi:mRNA interferase RelE/StbE